MKAVLLADSQSLRYDAIVQAVIAVRGIPAADAALEARRCWGVLTDAADDALAARWAGALNAAGLRSLILDSAALVRPAEAIPVQQFLFHPDGVALRTRTGKQVV